MFWTDAAWDVSGRQNFTALVTIRDVNPTKSSSRRRRQTDSVWEAAVTLTACGWVTHSGPNPAGLEHSSWEDSLVAPGLGRAWADFCKGPDRRCFRLFSASPWAHDLSRAPPVAQPSLTPSGETESTCVAAGHRTSLLPFVHCESRYNWHVTSSCFARAASWFCIFCGMIGTARSLSIQHPRGYECRFLVTRAFAVSSLSDVQIHGTAPSLWLHCAHVPGTSLS